MSILDWFKRKKTEEDYEKWSELSKSDKDLMIDILESRILDLEDITTTLIEEFGETVTYCDKCLGSNDDCFKCKNTGVVQRKQLFSWKW